MQKTDLYQSKQSRTRFVLLGMLSFVFATVIPSFCCAEVVVFSHDGATDPLSESWSAIGPGTGITTGMVIDDLGSGTDAWFVDDSSVAAGSFIHYNQTPDAAVLASAANGWSLALDLRMVESTVGFSDGMFIDYANGIRNYSMIFDRTGDGDPMVSLVGGGSHTIEGIGDSGYHDYELRFDAIAGTADLFVDGVETISDYAGTSSSTIRVNWGANGSNATGRGHFNSVTFSVVPEPSGGFIAGICTLMILARRRKTI